MSQDKFKEFRERFQVLMNEHETNPTKLSKLTKVPRSNIQSWLTGSAPNIDQLGLVAQELNSTVDELYFGHKPRRGLNYLLEELEIHNELYRISIKKVVKKDKGDV